MAAQPLPPRHFFRIAALAFAVAVSAGCSLWSKPYSPLDPLDPTPRRLGDSLQAIEARTTEARDYKVEGKLELSGQGVVGKLWGRGNLLYAAPRQLRFRASRVLGGVVLDLLQNGSWVAISQGNRIYVGSVEELSEFPELVGGIEPLEVMRALLIGRTVLNAAEQARALGAAPGALPFDDKRLTLTVEYPPDGDPPRQRREEYVVRRRDALVEEARVFERFYGAEGAEWEPVMRVEFRRYADFDGILFPKNLVIRSERPRTRLEVDVETLAQNPGLDPRVFQMDPLGMEIVPLRDLIIQQEQEKN